MIAQTFKSANIPARYIVTIHTPNCDISFFKTTLFINNAILVCANNNARMNFIVIEFTINTIC